MKTGSRKKIDVAGHAKAFIQGDAVDSRLFKRHFFVTAFTIITCLLFIAARFDNATKSRDIRALNARIEQERTRMQKELSRYYTLTRESAMRQLVDSLNLGLAVPEASSDQRPGTLHLK